MFPSCDLQLLVLRARGTTTVSICSSLDSPRERSGLLSLGVSPPRVVVTHTHTNPKPPSAEQQKETVHTHTQYVHTHTCTVHTHIHAHTRIHRIHTHSMYPQKETVHIHTHHCSRSPSSLIPTSLWPGSYPTETTCFFMLFTVFRCLILHTAKPTQDSLPFFLPTIFFVPFPE